MKSTIKSIFFLCLLIPGFVFSQSKEDIAREIFIDESFRKEISILQETFDKQRKDFVELYEPFYGLSKTPPEILAMQEQLYIDAASSNVFKFDSSEFERSLIDDITSLLTTEELLELREIYQRPVFKKLDSINETILKTTRSYMESWQKSNLKTVEHFEERNDEISKKLEALLELRKNEKL